MLSGDYVYFAIVSGCWQRHKGGSEQLMLDLTHVHASTDENHSNQLVEAAESHVARCLAVSSRRRPLVTTYHTELVACGNK